MDEDRRTSPRRTANVFGMKAPILSFTLSVKVFFRSCSHISLEPLPPQDNTMSSSKLLVVLGATGNQGSSVIDAVLQDTTYHIRGLTRNTDSKKATALKDRGVEPVSADVNSPSTLATAFAEATAIYAVTDFWGPFLDPANKAKVKEGQTINQWAYEHELQQAKNIIDAAAQIPTLTHFIWSGLSSAKKWSKGKCTWVYHFDSKADATAYIKDTHPALWAKTSVFMMGQYLSNHLLLPFLRPQKDADDVYEFRLACPADAPWPYISAAEDTGPFIKALLSIPPASGKSFLGYRGYMGPGEFLELWGKINHVPTAYTQISLAEMMANEQCGREGAESYGYIGEFGHEAREDTSVVHPKDVSICPAFLGRCRVARR